MSQAAGTFDFWMKAEVLQSALNDSEDLKVEMLVYQKKYPQTLGEAKGEERHKALMNILVRTVTRERDAQHRLDRERFDARQMEKMTKGHPAAPAPQNGSGKNNGKGKGSQTPTKGGKGAGQGKNRSQSAKGNRKGNGGKGNSGDNTGNLCVY